MNRKRFEFALERLKAGDWERFERLASTFFVTDYPDLRTLASPSGDGGRDATLFSPTGDSTVALQFSVTEKWRAKIIHTAGRLKEEHPDVSLLVYATNQEIGATADDTKQILRKEYNLFLDVRDKNWFAERVNSDAVRQLAAEELASEIVDPHLAEREIIQARPQALTTTEARAGLVYLGLQWEDESREKGLTRVCFEALVRAVLRETDSSNRLGREEIYRRISETVPNHPAELIARFTDGALRHLPKTVIKHWQSEDEFCLAHEERLRLDDRMIEVAGEESKLDAEISARAQELVERQQVPIPIPQLRERARRIIESFFLSRGELFAGALRTGDVEKLALADLRDFVVNDVRLFPIRGTGRAAGIGVVQKLVEDLLQDPGEATHAYLRQLTDAYTLLAFLRETPDVQSAVQKMFSFGDIWLDTSVVLPLFAEVLVVPERWQFKPMIRAAREAGLKLHITSGVLEEVERHMNRALTRARGLTGEWVGSVPFLYSVYVETGRSSQSFGSWLENFRGNARPEDDVAMYLHEEYGIDVFDLMDQVDQAPSDLRHAVQEVWHSAHSRRRRDQQADDPLMTLRLVQHDVENYLGVMQRRSVQERTSPLGYSSWWLTLDRVAFEARTDLRARLGSDPPPSPIMSPDFLANYLAIGPIRARVPHKMEAQLPLFVRLGIAESLPAELLEVAERVREENKGRSEHVIQRMVRDKLDAAKSRMGPTAKAGLGGVKERLIGESTQE